MVPMPAPGITYTKRGLYVESTYNVTASSPVPECSDETAEAQRDDLSQVGRTHVPV